MPPLHWLLVLSLGLVLIGALGYAGFAAIGRAMFDAPPKRPARDETAPPGPGE